MSLAYRHFKMSRQNVQPFKLNPEGESRLGKIMGISTSQKDLGEFVRHFNNYIDEYNRGSKRQNLISAWGYAVASLTALFSLRG